MKRCLPVALAWAVLTAWLYSAKNQPPDPPPRLVLSTEPIDKPPRADADLRPNALRPNITQEILTYLQNDGAEARTVIVQLLAGGVAVASRQMEVAPGKLVQVAWPGIPPPPAAAVKPPVLTELTPPVAFRLLDAQGRVLGKDVVLEVDRPSYYLDAELEFVPARGEENNRLIATVTPNARFKGPRCRVQMVLDPLRIPGFIVGQKPKGVYAGFVTAARSSDGVARSLFLAAEDIRLRPDARNGVVTLQADGYNRAFTFRTTFARSGTKPRPQERSKQSLRLDMAGAADPRKPVRVGIEADNLAQPADARLVLEVLSVIVKSDKEVPSEQFSPLAEFRGERNIQLMFAVGGKRGGLLFRPEVKDWGAELDLGGLHGATTLRLRLLDKDNRPREVLDAESEKTTIEVRKSVMLDDTAPEEVRFEALPPRAVRTLPLTLSASGIDPESDIRDVVFFVGKLPPDAKLPADSVAALGRRARIGGKVWSAELPVPTDAPPVLDVSVRFINNAGLSTTRVAQLPVADPPPPRAKVAKLASIAGTVTEGDRTQRALPVELQDPAGKVLAKTETNASGAYLFKDLAPGDYQVSAVKVASDTKGVTPVKLAAGEDKKGIVVQLWR
ncbi:MAG TPA: carboxypeptidase-like regulatory domain-containing protein [Gemmataceae bacterium]|nr:carboxypeptidase-like regulatory domain-containing protein [Gemmataceae bacterium]